MATHDPYITPRLRSSLETIADHLIGLGLDHTNYSKAKAKVLAIGLSRWQNALIDNLSDEIKSIMKRKKTSP